MKTGSCYGTDSVFICLFYVSYFDIFNKRLDFFHELGYYFVIE